MLFGKPGGDSSNWIARFADGWWYVDPKTGYRFSKLSKLADPVFRYTPVPRERQPAGISDAEEVRWMPIEAGIKLKTDFNPRAQVEVVAAPVNDYW
jgi:hypothetical protein